GLRGAAARRARRGRRAHRRDPLPHVGGAGAAPVGAARRQAGAAQWVRGEVQPALPARVDLRAGPRGPGRVHRPGGARPGRARRRGERMRTTWWIALLATLALASGAAAQDAKLVEAARKEGKVVWYTSLALPTAERLAKAFEAAYPGIKVEVNRTGSERILQRMMPELQA